MVTLMQCSSSSNIWGNIRAQNCLSGIYSHTAGSKTCSHQNWEVHSEYTEVNRSSNPGVRSSAPVLAVTFYCHSPDANTDYGLALHSQRIIMAHGLRHPISFSISTRPPVVMPRTGCRWLYPPLSDIRGYLLAEQGEVIRAWRDSNSTQYLNTTQNKTTTKINI
jgi:hypothetical protein